MIPYLRIVATQGLDWSVPAHRLPLDRRLADLVNTKIDLSGQLSPMEKFGLTLNGNCHSLYTSTDTFLVKDGVLYRWRDQLEEIFSPIVGPVSYAEIGTRLYFTDGSTIQFIEDGVVQPLEDLLTGVVEESLRQWYQDTYMSTPAGQLISHHQSRLFVARGDVLWFSDPFAYHRVNLIQGFISFSGVINFLHSADRCLYVGDAAGIHVLSGSIPTEMTLRRVSESRAFQRTFPARVAQALVSELKGPLGEDSFIFLTKDGPVLGDGEGSYIPLMQFRIGPIDGQVAACAYDRSSNILYFSVS